MASELSVCLEIESSFLFSFLRIFLILEAVAEMDAAGRTLVMDATGSVEAHQ